MASDLAAARRVLNFASEALMTLSASLNGDFTRAIGLLLAAKGRVIVSGMGKSGHVARKIAATLSSTGTPAYFVHPAEAAHGDMGAIARSDVLLLLSWGGETAELSALITYAKRYRIPLIGIGAKPESTLMNAADVKLLLPLEPMSLAEKILESGPVLGGVRAMLPSRLVSALLLLVAWVRSTSTMVMMSPTLVARAPLVSGV